MKSSYGTQETLIKSLIWNIAAFFQILKKRPETIYSCFLDTLPTTILASRIMNIPVIYDPFDNYADCLDDSVPAIIRKVLKWTEIELANKAEVVILADETRVRQYENRLLNTIIIYNSPINSIATDEPSDNIQENSTHEFTIFYAGILSKDRGIESMLLAAGNVPGIRIIIAGYGKDVEYYKDLFNKYPSVTFLGTINYQSVIEYTRKASLLFALYDPSITNNKFASPNKLFEAMMCGKPIMVSSETSMSEKVLREGCGVVVEYDNVDQIQSAITRLRDDPALCASMGNNGRTAYKREYSWEIMEKRLKDSMESITAKSK
jgi:glycosyltransferase involved in cell wall biosynthesis